MQRGRHRAQVKPFCRRCLLEDMPSEAALMENIRDLISLLPQEQRADDELRVQRLSHCRSCDHLADGTCALCSCFVELRSAKLRMRCPHVPPKW